MMFCKNYSVCCSTLATISKEMDYLVKKNHAIHGLRGMASLMVVLFHIYGMAYIGGFFRERDAEGLFGMYYNLGPMGVNLFFMISGYLIVGSLVRHANFKKFMLNRIIRIYPVFLSLHIVLFLIGPIINYEGLGGISRIEYVTHFLTNLFLLPGMFDLPIFQKNAWSLSYEFTFYIISSLFIVATLRIKNSILKYGSLFILLSVSFWIVFVHHTAIFFVLGALVFTIKNNLKEKSSYKKHNFLNGIFLLLALFYFYDSDNALSVFPLLLSVLLFWSIIKGEGLLSKILNTKIFQYLGTISYSLYLIHPFVLFPFKIVFSMERVNSFFPNEYVTIAVFAGAGLTFSIIFSQLSYYLIEEKFTDRLKKQGNLESVKTNEDIEGKPLIS